MAAQGLTKRVAINKANAQMVAVVGIASFISIFCLVASKAALAQNSFQAKVISGQSVAHKQLTSDVSAAAQLVSSYKSFVGSSTNVIGGSSTGTADNDGDNAKIVLDALPSSYDFPALASSLEKILTNQSLKISSITGTDDQLNQQANISSGTPSPVPMPFSFSVSNANYASIQQLIKTLETSIRPIQIDTMTLSGGANNMQLTITAHTYYQPAKSFTIAKKPVTTGKAAAGAAGTAAAGTAATTTTGAATTAPAATTPTTTAGSH